MQYTQIPLVDAPVIPLYLYTMNNGDFDLELGEHSLYWHPGMTTYYMIQHMISHPPTGLPTNHLKLDTIAIVSRYMHQHHPYRR